MKRITHSPCRIIRSARAVLFAVLGALLFVAPVGAHENDPHADPHAGHGGTVKRNGKDVRLSVGETVYKHMCTFCHGHDGNGGGRAMAYLYPWPRDFRKGVFKHRSTPTGSLPQDRDLFDTIVRGIPGTAMPAWETALSEEETWSVVEYLKSFSPRFKTENLKEPITPGTPPAATPEIVEKGSRLYQELRCERCHGASLHGDGPMSQQLFDIWDHQAFVYDLNNPNTYKWGFQARDIFMTLTTGVDGSPMKSYSHLTDEERWALATFVASRVKQEQYQKASYEIDIKVSAVNEPFDDDPENPLWDKVPSNVVKLLPLNARRDPINRVQIQTMVNEKEIAFRVSWGDPVANRTSSRHQDFKDAVALEFALGDVTLHTHGHNEPFFGMGNRGKPVNIWQWRADWQQEIETKKKLDYAVEEAMDMDVMIFGGEVNPVDSLNPFREVPIEEMNAEGFGTLTPQPQTKQNITGKGVYKDGAWTVVFRRTLESLNRWDIKFTREHPILIGFAIWDGQFQDRNGRKTVSMWQRLNLP